MAQTWKLKKYIKTVFKISHDLYIKKKKSCSIIYTVYIIYQISWLYILFFFTLHTVLCTPISLCSTHHTNVPSREKDFLSSASSGGGLSERVRSGLPPSDCCLRVPRGERSGHCGSYWKDESWQTPRALCFLCHEGRVSFHHYFDYPSYCDLHHHHHHYVHYLHPCHLHYEYYHYNHQEKKI